MMVIFLAGLVSMIMMRTLRNDYAKYARLETLESSGRRKGDTGCRSFLLGIEAQLTYKILSRYRYLGIVFHCHLYKLCCFNGCNVGGNVTLPICDHVSLCLINRGCEIVFIFEFGRASQESQLLAT